MKRIKLNLIIISIASIFLFSCEKDFFDKTSEVTFKVNDQLGKVSGCNYRIVKANGCKCEFSPEDILTHSVNGTSSYTFEDVEPGTYAGLIGTVGNTYEEFTVEKGEHVTLTYTYGYAGSISGSFSSGVGYSAAIGSWSCNITKE